MEKNALISDCGTYRYKLSRIWDNSKTMVLFIMLNPSTADANDDDPTIRRCIGFAKSWGFGGIMVGNMFPFRATNPKELKKNQDKVYDSEVHRKNIEHIQNMKFQCEITVSAWGNPPINKLSIGINEGELFCLDLTASGNPKHPLYLKKDLRPKKYTI